MAKREYFWGFYKLRSILGVNIYRNRSTYVSGTGHQGHEVPATTVQSNTYTIWHRGYSMNNPLGLRLFSSTNNKPWTKLEQPLPAATTSSKHTIPNWYVWIKISYSQLITPNCDALFFENIYWSWLIFRYCMYCHSTTVTYFQYVCTLAHICVYILQGKMDFWLPFDSFDFFLERQVLGKSATDWRYVLRR